ncbi:YozE family protein [Enterococcus sp. LJL90]
MKRSFYHYVMTLRGPNTKITETKLANEIGNDIQFPKQSSDYHEISSYLEIEGHYVENMDDFDALWEKYTENNR